MKLNGKKPATAPQKQGYQANAPVDDTTDAPKVLSTRKVSRKVITTPSDYDTTTPSNHATMQPRNRGIAVSRYHEGLIKTVRAAVKLFGKEAATHRFTLEEKKAIADLVYTYRQTGIRTNENEITRIGVNLIITDYRENGEASVLDRVLKALNS